MSNGRIFKTGFTLVELLVVIAIIGVLCALIMPTISAAREQTLRARCAANLKQFMVCITAYDVAYKNYPTGNNGKGNAFYDWTGGTPAYVTLKNDFGMAEKILNCPSQIQQPIMTRSNGGDYRNNTSGVLYLGYFYIAGYGGRNQSAPGSFNDVNGWFSQTFPARKKGWIPTTSGVTNGGCKVFGEEVSIPQTLQPSRMFIANDYGYSRLTNPNLRWADQSSHLSKDQFSCAGINTAFQDGHVAWSNMEVGRSWWIAENWIFSNEPDKPTECDGVQ